MDGGYVYHDITRDILLQEWQDDVTEQQSFDQYNERLVKYYINQHLLLEKNVEDLESVSAIIHRANPNRYVQLALILETRVVTPMLEALYHQTLRSAQTGQNLFERYFGYYETTRRLTICQSLLSAMRTYLHQLPPERGPEKPLQVLRIYEARLAWRLQRFSEAESLLLDIFSRAENDLQLKVSGIQ